MIKIDGGKIEFEGMGGEILAELLTLISSETTLDLIKLFVSGGPEGEFKELLKEVYNAGEKSKTFAKKNYKANKTRLI